MPVYPHRTVATVLIVVLATALVTIAVKDSSSQTTVASSDGQSVGPNGIRLTLSIDTMRIAAGQNLTVSVSLFNTLSKANSIATSDHWPFKGVSVALWPPCDDANLTTPVEAVVIKGDYTMTNITTAANVNFPVDCREYVNVDHAIFQPSSSEANLTGIYDVSRTNQTIGPFQLSTSFTTSGYWDISKPQGMINNQNPPLPPATAAFVPGEYTVAVADEWGQAVILHFVVVRA